MLEDQVLFDRPGVVHDDVLARNAVVRIYRRKTVAEVVAGVDVI